MSDKYLRQIIFDKIGNEGQEKIRKTSIEKKEILVLYML